MQFEYNDGGRATAGYKGHTGDCACRAVAIAAELPYQEVYDKIIETASRERKSKRRRRRSHPRTGVYAVTMHRLLVEEMGWLWTPTMEVGSGCTTHIDPDELPEGRLILRVSKHYAAFIDGVLTDTHDCSRKGTRCVYGYWHPPA